MDYTEYYEREKMPRFYGGGNGKKIGIRLDDGCYYMIKFPPEGKEGIISYTNSCISEYICCHIFESLGIEAQKTKLGEITVHGKQKVVVACKDFNENDFRLVEFAMVKNGCFTSSQNGYGTEIRDVMEAINEQTLLPPAEVEAYFWNIFIVDTLLGNFDRHNGNWGFLVNEKLGEVKLAPIYDCGSCLYPQLSDQAIENVLGNADEMNKRIFVFPNSALKIGGKKINMHEYLMNPPQGCRNALKNICSRINMEKISSIIMQTPYISDIRKQFYYTMIKLRYEKLLLPALKKTKKPEISPRL